MLTPSSPARLEARLPHDVHALLKRAAEIQGRTLTDFIVAVASEAARKTVEEADVLRLAAKDQKRLAEALIAPPEPSPALKKAARLWRRSAKGRT